MTKNPEEDNTVEVTNETDIAAEDLSNKPDRPLEKTGCGPDDLSTAEEQKDTGVPSSDQPKPGEAREEGDGQVSGSEKEDHLPGTETDQTDPAAPTAMDGHDNSDGPRLTNGDETDGAPPASDASQARAEDEPRGDDNTDNTAEAGNANNEEPVQTASATEATPADNGTEADKDGDKLTNGKETDEAVAVPEERSGEQAAQATSTKPVNQEGEYEDDFSEMSEKSDRNAGAAPVATENQQDGAGDGPQRSKSPAPSSTDEVRAEAGTVVPVPVPVQKSDGRSLVEERGEIRGEDRSEARGDGGEDSRGEGQWKSEEELFLQTSLNNQHAEKEALQTVIDDKTRVMKEHDNLKGRFVALEENSKKWEMEAGMLKEKCLQQDSRIKELESSESRLSEFESWGKDNEAKVKDLQDRLSSLAGEDAEKDRRIQKLQEELNETKSRLVAAERQVVINAEATAQQPAVQQSKTCAIL